MYSRTTHEGKEDRCQSARVILERYHCAALITIVKGTVKKNTITCAFSDKTFTVKDAQKESAMLSAFAFNLGVRWLSDLHVTFCALLRFFSLYCQATLFIPERLGMWSYKGYGRCGGASYPVKISATS